MILYSDLTDSVQSYLSRNGRGESLEKVHAYLFATLNAIVEFQDRYPACFEPEVIFACKGINNLLKHEQSLITPVKIQGGVSFPIQFPLASETIKIVWRPDLPSGKYSDQSAVYHQYFAGKEIIQTLEPIVSIINGYEVTAP